MQTTSTKAPAGVLLRAFTPHDYDALARVRNSVLPEHPSTPQELRAGDGQYAADGRLRHERLLAEVNGEVVGYAEYTQNPGAYHPRRFLLGGGVHAHWQGRGIGRALYDALMVALAPLDPLSVRAHTRADSTAASFLTTRGYRETMRTWESTLDPRAFDFGPYEGLEERLRGKGITLLSARELRRTDPAWREQLHDVFSESRLDVPRSEPVTPITFEQFGTYILNDPGFLDDGYFVAVHDGRAVGSSDLYRSDAADGLFTGFTGVRRAYRGRGIALALKVRALRYAAEAGAPWVRTDNASTNRPMLAVNEKLGFRKEPAWVSLVHDLDRQG